MQRVADPEEHRAFLLAETVSGIDHFAGVGERHVVQELHRTGLIDLDLRRGEAVLPERRGIAERRVLAALDLEAAAPRDLAFEVAEMAPQNLPQRSVFAAAGHAPVSELHLFRRRLEKLRGER